MVLPGKETYGKHAPRGSETELLGGVNFVHNHICQFTSSNLAWMLWLDVSNFAADFVFVAWNSPLTNGNILVKQIVFQIVQVKFIRIPKCIKKSLHINFKAKVCDVMSHDTAQVETFSPYDDSMSLMSWWESVCLIEEQKQKMKKKWKKCCFLALEIYRSCFLPLTRRFFDWNICGVECSWKKREVWDANFIRKNLSTNSFVFWVFVVDAFCPLSAFSSRETKPSFSPLIHSIVTPLPLPLSEYTLFLYFHLS